MRREQPIIVGLDIGTTKVAAIAGRKNEFGKLEILGFGRADSAGVNHGVVINIEQCVRSIEQAIEACLASNLNLEVNEVYVGIAGQHIKSLQTKGERVRANEEEMEISREDIELLIRDQRKTYIPPGDEIIDIVPQDFTVDSITGVIDPIGMTGVKVGANFHIVTGDKNAIRNIKRCVDKSNLKTRDLMLQPLASATAVISDEDLEAGVAIVDIGGGTTDMAVFYDGILKHTAVIPYAGVNITNDIRHGLGVLRTQAEQIKTQFGIALADEANGNAYITIPGLRGMQPKEVSIKNLSHIIQARMQEILDYVMYNLKQVNLDKRLNGGIILTGGGAQLKHLTQLTEFVTGLGARIGHPNEHLAGGHSEALNNPMYSTCIGLILRGYDDFESGRMRFAEEGGNYIRMTQEEVAATVNTTPEPEIVMPAPMPFQGQNPVAPGVLRKRNEKVKNLFTLFKGKFMEMFEDVEDTEIN
jgi:cell division protein FtsA